MPARSAARAIAPPSASISLARWALPMPPIDGLQLICPSVSRFCVTRSVSTPMRAAAGAASAPARPPPTTMQPKRSGWSLAFARVMPGILPVALGAPVGLRARWWQVAGVRSTMRQMPSLQTFVPRGRRAVAAIAVAAASLAAAAHGPTRAEPGGLEETRCRLDAPRLPAVLAFRAKPVAPEDGTGPGGPDTTLYHARGPGQAAVLKPDPLVLHAGGPGKSAVGLYLQMRRAFEPVRIERDIVLLDQRGTGRSADGFECSLTEGAAFDTTAVAELYYAIDGCLAELERDPRFFSTEPAVD